MAGAGDGATAAKPSTGGAPAAAAALGKRWIWRKADGALESFFDPSVLPETAVAHEARLYEKLWGPNSARLVTVTVVQQTAQGKILVQEPGKGSAFEVPPTLILTWYEGLLVLDAVTRAIPTLAWVAELKDTLEAERTRFKQKGEEFDSAQYVEQRLLNVAITGPAFLDSFGRKRPHRRGGLRKELPSLAENKDGYYEVESLEGYIPPWEAFVRNGCGIYQDFYLVRWGGTHSATDYSATECGGTMPGATWEPDECLPDDLDQFRILAKKRWVQQRKEHERKGNEAASQNGMKLPTHVQAIKPLVRRASSYNPMNRRLFEDMAEPGRGHAWSSALGAIDDRDIQRGWPKRPEDYPKGHAPVEPPGACNETCNCMEDWHMGRVDVKKAWLQDTGRMDASRASMETFIQMCQVVRRGQVSGMHYLEPSQLSVKPLTARAEGMLQAREFAKMVVERIQEMAKGIPLGTLKRGDSGEIVRALSLAFTCTTGALEFRPLQFRLAPGHPPWLSIDGASGALRAAPNTDIKTIGNKPVAVNLDLCAFHGDLAGTAREVYRIDFKIDPTVPEDGSNLVASTQRVATQAVKLTAASLQALIRRQMEEAFNFDRGSAQRVPVVRWADIMTSVVLSARAASGCHLFS